MVAKYKSKLSVKRGRYGASKCKAFSVLASQSPDYPLTARQLCIYTGIPYHSLARALVKWWEWEYVKRMPCLVMGLGDYEYSILSKAKHWLRLAKADLPNYQLFVDELSAWRLKVDEGLYDEFMALKFVDFVTALDAAVKGRVIEGGSTPTS